MKLTQHERQTLLAVLRGAQDDDDGLSDPDYTKALASLVRKARAEKIAKLDAMGRRLPGHYGAKEGG